MFSCVRNNHDVTDLFDCPVGVRQGCTLSTSLFLIFINEIADYMLNAGRHGIQFLPGLVELYILLFADDLALLSYTPVGLRNQLECLSTCCKRLKLEVNVEKSKAMVFRKGGFLGVNESWYFEGKLLEVVNSYRYLGYSFTTMLSVTIGTQSLAVKGKEAAYGVLRMLRQYQDLNKKTFFKIFDSKITSILLYASEVWGTQQVENIEKVHLIACKRFLGLPRGTPNNIVYGELGRYPLHVNSSLRCIKYWLKVIQMSESRLPFLAYKMLVSIDERGKRCWATNIKELLFNAGFGIVWINQGVGNSRAFLSLLKQRLFDMFIQGWHGALCASERYDSYRSSKIMFAPERYIDYFSHVAFRQAITQFRAGMFPLNVNIHRYDNGNSRKMCFCCPDCFEDEHHFLFVCPLYTSLRDMYITPNKHDIANIHTQHNLWLDMTLLKALANFLVFALNLRKRTIRNEWIN